MNFGNLILANKRCHSRVANPARCWDFSHIIPEALRAIFDRSPLRLSRARLASLLPGLRQL
jgi:hypothetical protein